ncbi:MAG: PIG-L deacetylase family protein [Fimbriimonadaceae bacterium]
MSTDPLTILCIGAHPDDCEGSLGGTAVLWRARGDRVVFATVTDGSRGHFSSDYLRDPGSLIERRRQEALAAADPLGIEYRFLGFRDGEVQVDSDSTAAVVRLIRSVGDRGVGPDLVVTNRICDYHRDHRVTAQLVLDAAYLLTVPFLCPETPALRRMPVFAYWSDEFTEAGAFRPDVVVPIDSVADLRRAMIVAHESQFLEWIPWNSPPGSPFSQLPEEPEPRRRAAAELMMGEARRNAERLKSRLPPGCRYAEAFQISEYGTFPDLDAVVRLFPREASILLPGHGDPPG